MKIKKIIQTIKEVDISLPYYCKNICHWYKIYSKDKCIQVFYSKHEDCGGLQSISASIPLENNDNIQCTEEEFNEKFEIVLEQLKKYKNESKF